MRLNSRPVRRLVVAAVAAASVLTVSMLASEAATPKSSKTSKTTAKTKVTKKAKATKRRATTKRATTTVKRPTTTKAAAAATTTTPNAAVAAVLAGYENYFTAFVAAAREPERAEQLLPAGMTGDALARMLEIRRLDATEGLYWDGTRKSIISGPRIESIGETTATLRDCRSVGGVVRNKGTGAVVAGTTEPDVDDMRVTFVLMDGNWVVTATERFNDVEGRSRCVPGSPSP
jgi:hypothetical protein